MGEEKRILPGKIWGIFADFNAQKYLFLSFAVEHIQISLHPLYHNNRGSFMLDLDGS